MLAYFYATDQLFCICWLFYRDHTGDMSRSPPPSRQIPHSFNWLSCDRSLARGLIVRRAAECDGSEVRARDSNFETGTRHATWRVRTAQTAICRWV